MRRVVVVGGGIAGIYFAYRLLQAVQAEVVLVEPKPVHEFVIGIPMAYGGLVAFRDLIFPLSQLKKVRHVWDHATALDGTCVRLSNARNVCGDYVVLAPGSYKVGTAEYWSVEGAERLYELMMRTRAVRFIVSEFTPVIGFQEIAYAVKTRFPEKEVSVHLIYVSDDYVFLLEPWKAKAKEIGVEVTGDPPPHKAVDELHISVPAVRPHPLTAGLELKPETLETQYERVYLIGDSALLKLGLPPIGWGSLWQASLAAQAVASEISKGYIEISPDEWSSQSDPESFKRWLTFRMATGTPLVHLKGLYQLWARNVVASL
ncbi:FAD-dependent pyridine nucleotide-disulfide oxidoreductase [Thermoproteus uzoniensis 768-20]|uniref:FAD-dependent pyridine nucleotide-disulfide oxidoreductase n=1 Tax=Thermoproteus uzoniensis (strain 768-20) TaxID=999630 RepID=F2L4Q5_THEU7|nr:FAD-dependent oxidoreductase [Thermoproteus uzoniensis]AEA12233.1 FAD-dependent pyridine nucleotide-disulfide oxidoreductase [Thermoproteus uzoniensis 768-20]